MSESSVPLRNPYLAAFLAWLWPGLGHFYQGRKAKGWLYAISILSLYFIGFAMGEARIVYWRWVSPLSDPEHFSIYYLGQFFVGLPALPALIQGTLHYFEPTISVLGGFMAPPEQSLLNGLHPRLGKLVEVGTIYTTVAGLLNILAIYDAYEGPAYDALADDETAPEPRTELGALKAEGQA